jgi:hypothetical protein
MYDDPMKYECNLHKLNFEYPRNWDELHLSPPKCPVCFCEDAEKWRGEYERILDHRNILLKAIDIKLNTEIE